MLWKIWKKPYLQVLEKKFQVHTHIYAYSIGVLVRVFSKINVRAFKYSEL